MTCPWVSVLNGTKVPTSEKEVRSRDFLVCKIVTTRRPSACKLARNSVAMPSRSTIVRARLSVLRVLFIARKARGDAHCEMLVPSMSGDEEGMTVLVVEQQQRSAAQDDAAFARSVREG
jgi:hypothetical protein